MIDKNKNVLVGFNTEGVRITKNGFITISGKNNTIYDWSGVELGKIEYNIHAIIDFKYNTPDFQNAVC